MLRSDRSIRHNRGYLDQVPAEPAARRAWLRALLEQELHEDAGLYRDKLVELCGTARAAGVRYAEAFEASEYGAPLSAETIARLFPSLAAE